MLGITLQQLICWFGIAGMNLIDPGGLLQSGSTVVVVNPQHVAGIQRFVSKSLKYPANYILQTRMSQRKLHHSAMRKSHVAAEI